MLRPHQLKATLIGEIQASFWDSSGKVGGTFAVVGVVVAAILAILLILFLKYRKNKEQQDFEKTYDEVKRSATGAYSTSSSSQIHSSGGGGGAAPFVYTDEKGIVNTTTTSPKSPTSNTQQPVNTPESEVSEPVVLDQRLDPQHLMSQWETNGSRVSLADDVDYSRKVLRVINE